MNGMGREGDISATHLSSLRAFILTLTQSAHMANDARKCAPEVRETEKNRVLKEGFNEHRV